MPDEREQGNQNRRCRNPPNQSHYIRLYSIQLYYVTFIFDKAASHSNGEKRWTDKQGRGSYTTIQKKINLYSLPHVIRITNIRDFNVKNESI